MMRKSSRIAVMSYSNCLNVFEDCFSIEVLDEVDPFVFCAVVHVEDINSYTFYSDDKDRSFYIGDDLLEGPIIAADICCMGCS